MEDSVSASVSSVRTLHQPTPNPPQTAAQTDREQLPSTSSGGINVKKAEERLFDVYHDYPTSAGLNLSALTTASHSLVLPSPPDSPGLSPSPSIDSVSESSFPSVSSSFFFSSAAASPGRPHPGSYPSSHPHSDHEQDHELHQPGLVIPSLSLPDALPRPTPFGQTLGQLKVLVLGGQGAGKSFLTGLLLEDNEDVVDVGTWEDWDGGEDGTYGKVLKASTDWTELHDAFGLERYEATKNVEIVELPGYSHDTDVNELISRLKSIIEVPFRELHDVLHPETQPSAMIASMLAAPNSPLYTAMVFLLPSPPTPIDREIILALSSHIPLIVLPRLQGPQRSLGGSSFASSSSHQSAKLSSFKPASAVALRSGLFHSPETVALLRSEAADRFMKWREVERAVEEIWEGSITDTNTSGKGKKVALGNRSGTLRSRQKRRLGETDWGRSTLANLIDVASQIPPNQSSSLEGWSKAKWEAEWMETHSRDVAMRSREYGERHRSRTDTLTGPSIPSPPNPKASATSSKDPHHVHRHGHAPFDPLHLPSLLMFSISLLGPLRARVNASIKAMLDSLGEGRVQVALVGGFCVGLGIGVWARAA